MAMSYLCCSFEVGTIVEGFPLAGPLIVVVSVIVIVDYIFVSIVIVSIIVVIVDRVPVLRRQPSRDTIHFGHAMREQKLRNGFLKRGGMNFRTCGE